MINQANLLDLRHDASGAIIGGKASGLQRLAAAGLPVPPGCVIGAGTVDEDIGRLADLVAQRWPKERLAVRSSGVAEDSLEASFAGQFETLLNVEPTAEAIATAIRSVRASARAEHVAGYQTGADLGMAVLIMPMIAADSAGIAFTRNPVSGSDEVVIEAVEGIADRLAAGEVQGERWTVTDRPRAGLDPSVLNAGQANAIAELARASEQHEGVPVDIEWALVGEKVVLLQSRPITTLGEIEPVPMNDEIPPGYWEWDSTHSRLPASPLLASVFTVGFERASRQLADEYGLPIEYLAMRSINGYLYISAVAPGGRHLPPPPPPIMRLMFSIIPVMRRKERAARRAFGERTYQAWHDRWRLERRPQIERKLSEWYDLDFSALDHDELAVVLEEAVEMARDTFAWNMVTDPAYLVPFTDLHRFVTQQLGGEIEMTTRLLAGSSRSEYRDSVSALATLLNDATRAEVTNDGPDLLDRIAQSDPIFATAYANHTRVHGARSLGFDLTVPVMLELPGAELQRIATLPTERDNSSGASLLAQGLRERLSPDRAAEFEELLASARSTYWIREEGEAVHASALGTVRLIMLEAGTRLVDGGQTDLPDHAAFLTIGELCDWLRTPADVRTLIGARRAQHRWAHSQSPVPSFGKPVPIPPLHSFPPNIARMMEMVNLLQTHDQRPANLDAASSGVPASKGVHTGPVRVVTGPEGLASVRRGDVLIAPITTSSWEVVFPHIGALVTEGGGQLSHPAIVAREYGLPAIVGCEGATTKYCDGDIVTVDGTTGRITPVDRTG